MLAPIVFLTRFTSGEHNKGSLKVEGRNQTASSTQPSGFLFCPRRFVADCQRWQSVNRQRGLRVSVRTRPHPSTRRDNPHQFLGGSQISKSKEAITMAKHPGRRRAPIHL